MTKIFRNVLISICGAFAFLFAGIFFSGCKVDYSKISLVSNVSSVELEVGETADVVFTIKNYKKGFSNKISVGSRSDETESIFEVPSSSIKYLKNDQVRVTIKAIAGGHGQLHVKTLEGKKECFVDVSVTQYSTSMSSRDGLSYVSNDTNFTPSPSMFDFDLHTTYTKLSHFYFSSRVDFDEKAFKIDSIDEENGTLRGFDGTGGELVGDIIRYDVAKLEKEGEINKLKLFLNGQLVHEFETLPNNFKTISIYDYSVDNPNYEEILFAFSDVYVLPSLNVKVSGGYLNEKTGEVDFKPIVEDRIVIVPNSTADFDMRHYILKMEMISAVVDSKITFKKETSNNFVDVDLYDEFMDVEENSGDVVHYWKISQNSQIQNSTDLTFSVFYDLAKEVTDENVNTTLSYQIDIEIAPTAVMVNGTSEPETFYLYNEYENDRFGWQEVLVDVVSGFNSSPNFDGVYFTFDQANIDVKYGDNDIVVSGNSRLYKDLSKSFYIRGKGDLGNQDALNATVVVHLVSDILPNELTLNLNCVIIKGATAILRSEDYPLSERSRFVLDADAGPKQFNVQLYADQMFQDVTYRCQSTKSVVLIEVDKNHPYIESAGRFFLNLTITPVDVGDSVYTLYLDNGTSTSISFSVVKTLQPETTRVFLLDAGNDAVSHFEYSRKDNAEFDNVLSLEILNNSNKENITFGSVAYIGFSANVKAGGISNSSSEGQIVSVSQTNGNYKLTTLANGNSLITFTLKGEVVEDFATVSRELEIFVYVSSYSRVDEFYLLNGSARAMENVVYYGSNTNLNDKTVVLSTVVNSQNSSNFNQYFFNENFAEIFDSENLIDGEEGFTYNLTGDEYYTSLQKEKFDKKFVYFYALRPNDMAVAGGVATKIEITKYWIDNGKNEELTKTIEVVSSNGLMFFANDFSYEKKDGDTTIATYEVKFSNIYNVGYYGTFDIETLTYVNSYDTSSISFVLEANISQRGLTRSFNARITSQQFISVDNISLASSLSELNLSSKKLTHTFGAYIYPSNATNKRVIAQFIPSSDYNTDNNLNVSLVDCVVQEGESGVYTITVSCENFYKYCNDRNIKIEELTDDLSGRLYIFPAEWGSSYTTLGGKEAIVIDVQYCNGSEKNPYVIETAEDVLEINSNEMMLKSHYKLATIIDMSSVSHALPIGVLNGENGFRLVGFSGSIIGTTSQAGITNIAVSNNNFYAEVDGTIYAGLFAQVGGESVDDAGQRAKIENVSFSGKVDLQADKTAYVSVLTARNKGKLENVGVTIYESTITAQDAVMFGGVTGENFGYIVQNFTAYDGSNYNDTKPSIYNGLVSKNLVYFDEFVNIVTENKNVYAGGISGVSYGTIERITSEKETYKLYGYSAYSAMTRINVAGNVSATTEVYVGGAVGKVSNEKTSSKIFGSTSVIDNKVGGLLVGGQISTDEIVGDVRDAIGGIVGFAKTDNVRVVSIVENVSRIFIRGTYYVGGIAGFDSYLQNANRVNFGANNKLEAVDGGAIAYEASMLIKASEVNNYSEKLTNGQLNPNPKEVFYAIGNAMTVNRDYTTTGGKFSAISYVKRSKLEGVVSSTNSSTNDYYGDYIVLKNDGTAFSYEFEKRDVSLGTAESEYQMKLDSKTEGGQSVNVYLMYYFAATGRLNGESETLIKDEISRLNYITPNSKFYPFSLTSQDVSISSGSTEISVDVNGNLTVKNVGLAYITLNSILNVKEQQKIYLYIVNYFDKDFDFSIFYTRPSSSGVNVVNGSSVNIYGNTNTSVYLVPSYELKKTVGEDGVVTSPVTADGESFSISKNGVLNFRNVSYVLSKNTQLFAEAEAENESNYSVVQVNKQTIIFAKSDKADEYEGEFVGDYYLLKPTLKIAFSIGDVEYVYSYVLSDNASISVEVRYKDAAESINPSASTISIKTNEPYSDSISVKSTNADEVLFYEIFQVIDGEQELIQSRMPNSMNEFINIDGSVNLEKWQTYINTINNENDLFGFNFIKNQNVFEYSCRVNDMSKRFLNRANVNIYGEYKVYLYASELEYGVSSMFRIMLSEAEINFVDITNYSNQKDLSVADEIVVPSQTGLLEIAVDPVEATFNKIEISNSELNYQKGATEASLLFVYEKNSEDGVEFVAAQNFGVYQNGKLSFTYQDMVNYFETLNDEFNRKNGVLNKNDKNYQKFVDYIGKVYVSYYMPSLNVDDGVKVGFDLSVYYGKDNIRQDNHINLITKLGSYARLKFDDKNEANGAVYVARGLTYGLSMESYGFSNDQISVAVKVDGRPDNSLAEISGGNGKYTLSISSDSINYGGSDDPGRKIEIVTTAEKFVDNQPIKTESVLTVYIMEYVLNYVYVTGVNEDIVKGMEDGIIHTAVGNPYELQFEISPFLEYDSSNSTIIEEVEVFVEEMTKNIEWAVYYNETKDVLENEKVIRTDYFNINSQTVTPLRIYNPETNLYHFSAKSYYRIENGTYSYSSIATGANEMYTEFAFKVHEQSTQDSPIPVESYEDFVAMKDGEWYILLKDITLPSSEVASVFGGTQFKPLTAKLAGFDGNGYRINMAGTYEYLDDSNIGLFESVPDGMILQNVDICVATDTVIKTNQSGFNVGLLTASNEGVITNCEVYSQSNSSLSVVAPSEASSAYVGGLVGNNSGHITHSRSKVNIRADVNVAGFVGQNSGKIASSFFMGASIKNQRTGGTSEYTAGFAVANSGEIYTSYVSGDPSESGLDEHVYYQGSQDSIESSNNIAGFVYTNTGNVHDCYSNIAIKQSGAFSAGFIFENSGLIERSFSTSVLGSNQTSNYGFMRTNNIGTTEGLVEDCFYLSDVGINVSIGTIVQNERLDLSKLTIADFMDIDNFKNFVVEEGRNINSVWFFSRSSANPINFNGSIFDLNRPELVAANIEATSMRQLDRTEAVVDPETGMSSVRYIYTYVPGNPALGTAENPILIYDATTMEDYIVRQNNGAGYNYGYYRLINDIDYAEFESNSKLYQTKFMGYIEGNFMEIDGLSLISSAKMNYSGLFAEVGRSSLSGAVGTLMNFTIRPISASFANTNVVGGITGRLDGGTIVNVRIENASDGKVVVSGINIVGGAVGIAIGDYKIQNLYSQVSAKAKNLSGDDTNHFNEANVNFDDCSMAGSVVGVVSGRGRIFNTVTDTSVSVLATKAGLVFGVVDSEANVEKVRLTVFDDMIVNAHSYGGLVVGEVKGHMTDIEVVGDSGAAFKNFMNTPYYSVAIGGIAGIMSGGEMSDVSMMQSIEISTESDSVEDPPYLGGVVGVISEVSILKNLNVVGNMTGFNYVGGIVGAIIEVVGQVNFENVNFAGKLVGQGHNIEALGIGGLAGKVGDGNTGDNSTFNLTSSILVFEKTKDESIYVKTNDTSADPNKQYYTLSNGNYTKVNGTPSGDISNYYELTSKTYYKLVEDEYVVLNAEELKQSEIGEYYERVYRKNAFNTSVGATVYTYGKSSEMRIGAIVGENTGRGSSFVADTNSRLAGEVNSYEMSSVLEQGTATLKVVEKVENSMKEVVVENSNSNAIRTSSIEGRECKFYCDVKFYCPISDNVDISHRLTVLNIGDADLKLAEKI